jgi:plastocyanin
LTATPDAGLRYTVVSRQESAYVPFLHPGSFVVSSKAAPAMKLTAVVSSKSGATCAFEPGPTISFEASYLAGAIGHYFWSAPLVAIKEGQTITLSNLTDQNLTFKSTPDASVAADMELDTNKHQVVLFPDGGVYTMICLRVPHLPVKVHVEANGA